jgi:hypothetical protein
MAKKVAQLTKVIYLLNTKNDEHEYELQCLEATYEADVADVLRDAQAKVQTLQQRLDHKASEELAAAAGGNEKALKQMEEMRKQQELEKKHALAKLEKLREQSAANEATVKNQAKDRIDAMKKEVEDAKTQFLIRMHSFSRVTKNMEAAHASALLEQRHKSLKEMEDYVQASNQKYNNMLNERMTIEEELRAKLKNQKESAASSKEMEARLAQAKAEADKALAAQAKKYEAAAAKLTQEAEAATDRLIKEKQERKDDAEKAEKLIKDLRRQLEELQQRSASDLADARTAAAKDAESAKKLLQESERKVADLQKQMEQLLSQAKQGVDASTKAWMEEKSTLQSQLSETQGELRDAQSKNDTLSKEKAALQAQATRLEKDLATANTAISDLQRALKDSQSALKDAQGEVKDMKARMADLSASSQGGLAQAQEALREEKKDHKQTRSSLAKTEEDLEKTKHELATLQVEDAALLEKYREAQYAQNDLREELKILQARYSALEVASEQTEQQMSQTIAELETKLKELQSQLKNLTGEQGAALEALQLKYSNLQRDYAQIEEDGKNSRALAQELAGQLEILRDEHARATADIISLREQLDREKNRLHEITGEGEQALQKLRGDYAALQQEFDALKRAHSRLDEAFVKLGKQADLIDAQGKSREAELLRQMESMRGAFADERRQLQGDAGRELERLKEEAKEREKRMQQELADLIAQHAATLAKLKEAHSTELQRVRLEAEARAKMSAEMERERMEAERKQLLVELAEKETILQVTIRSNAEKLQQLVNDHAAALSRQELAAKTELDAALSRMKKQWQEEVEDIKDELERQTRDARDQANAREAAAKKELDALETKYALEVERANALQGELTELQQEHAAFQDRTSKREASLIAAHRDALDDLTQQQRDELSRLMRANADEIARLHAAHSLAQSQWQDAEAALHHALSTLQYRFDHREPRAEDVARIRELEEYGVQAEKTKRKAIEEMKYYKLELLNREENYNKTFGRSPMVGGATGGGLTGTGSAGPVRSNPSLGGSAVTLAGSEKSSTGSSSVRVNTGHTGAALSAGTRRSTNPASTQQPGALVSSPSNKALVEEEKSANSRPRGTR